jgi:hypothetical protein
MSAKYPSNGGTLTKGKPIRLPRSAPDPARDAAQLAVDQTDAAKSRHMHKLASTDTHGFLRELGLASGEPKPPEPIKRRRGL